MQSGLLLIDKPTGVTSHDVVNSIRKISSQKQVGHAGTLDPLATGLMVVLMGEATKLSDFVLNGDKSYIVEMDLGVRTDTGDRDGQVIEEKPVEVTADEIARAIESMAGEFQWPVPRYSAVKVQGEKLYDLARENKVFTPPVKTMRFYGVRILAIEPTSARVQVSCSKGSFIRTWVEQVGAKLNCGATVKSLRRTASLPYSLNHAVPLQSYQKGLSGEHWIPIENSLPDWPILKVEGMEEKLIRNGQLPHRLSRYLEIEYLSRQHAGIKVFSRGSQRLLAVLESDGLGYRIKRVFNT